MIVIYMKIIVITIMFLQFIIQNKIILTRFLKISGVVFQLISYVALVQNYHNFAV